MSKANMERALAGKQVHLKTTSTEGVRDQLIRDAMDGITHKDPRERWSLNRFFEELTDPESDSIYEIVDRRMYIKTFSIW